MRQSVYGCLKILILVIDSSGPVHEVGWGVHCVLQHKLYCYHVDLPARGRNRSVCCRKNELSSEPCGQFYRLFCQGVSSLLLRENIRTACISKENYNAIFWDVVPWRSCVNRRFAEKCRLNLQSRNIRERGTKVSRWCRLQSVTCLRERTLADINIFMCIWTGVILKTINWPT